MPITLDGTSGVVTPGITLGSTAITASASQLNNASEDMNSENRIINGNFIIWQRSLSSSAAGFVAADRWANGFSGGTVTQSLQSFTIGEVLGNNNPYYFLRQAVSGQTLAAHYALTYQPIEYARTYAGQTVTVMGWAKRGSGTGNMVVEGMQNFGTGGSPSASVTGISPTTVTLGATWAPFAVVMNIPSVTGKTLGTNNNDWMGFQFWTSAGSDYNARANSLGLQTIGVDYWGIHIRIGTWTTADVPLYRERGSGTEYALCQRYCSIVYAQIQGGAVGAMITPWYTPVTMRAVPVVTVISAGTSVSSTPAADAVRYNGGGYFQTTITSAGGYTVDRVYRCDAEL